MKFGNSKFGGIGYGEYVHGSIDTREKVPYWSCFYLHFSNYDLNMCGDPVNSEYARIHLLYPNNTYYELQDQIVFTWMKPLRSWNSIKSNNTYFIEWEISIPILNIKLNAIPTIDNSEFCIFNNCFWIGTTNLYINNFKIGIGITEIFNFTKPINRIEFFSDLGKY